MKWVLHFRVRLGCLFLVFATCLWGQQAAKNTNQAKVKYAAEVPAASPQPEGAADPSHPYVIGNGDLLAINVWNEPDFKQSIPVRPDGKISLPLIGGIQAAGLTPQELQGAIAARLNAYINHPTVTVLVQQINSRNFNILGRVMKPGTYPLSTSMTVLDAIAAAGGFQDFAKQKDIYVLRHKAHGGEDRFSFNYKNVIKGKHMDQNITLEPHDTVVVP